MGDSSFFGTAIPAVPAVPIPAVFVVPAVPDPAVRAVPAVPVPVQIHKEPHGQLEPEPLEPPEPHKPLEPEPLEPHITAWNRTQK